MRTVLEFRAAATNAPAYISIHGDIGASGATAAAFEKRLKGLGETAAIELHINSPGGDLFQALAMFNMLDRHPARISVYVDGLAASAGSLVAMVGDEIIMPSNSMLMLHNPAGGVLGTSKDLVEMADVLDRLAGTMADIYARRSGLPRDRVLAIMDTETWYTAQEAVDVGFATRVEQPMAIAASFDVASRYRNPPPQLVQTVEALVEAYAPGLHQLQRGTAKTAAELSAKYWADQKGGA